MHVARSRRPHDARLSHLDAAPRVDRRAAQAGRAAAELVGLYGDVDAAHATL